MSEAPPLSVAFVETHPDTAARVLEGLTPADAAAAIGILPGRVSGLAVSRMTPSSAAHCLGALEPDRAANVIRNMTFQDAASVLRMMEETYRTRLMTALPDGLARDFARSMTYPQNSVGAWMDQHTSPLPRSRTVAEALAEVRRSHAHGCELFVIDADSRYVGVVRMADLIRSDDTTEIADLVDRGVPAISNRSTLASVAQDTKWDAQTTLAVVGRKGNFLGALSRAQMRAGLAAVRHPADGRAMGPGPAHLVTSFFVTMVGLLAMMLGPADGGLRAPNHEVRDER